MDIPYKRHIKRRFREKFQNINTLNNDTKYLRTIDVEEISNLALNTEGYLASKGTNNTLKKVIIFNGISMWAIIDPTANVLKTIYPVSLEQLKQLYKLTK